VAETLFPIDADKFPDLPLIECHHGHENWHKAKHALIRQLDARDRKILSLEGKVIRRDEKLAEVVRVLAEGHRRGIDGTGPSIEWRDMAIRIGVRIDFDAAVRAGGRS